MFTSQLKESTDREVTLKDIEPTMLESLLQFAYTGAVNITQANVQSLMAASNLLQVRRPVRGQGRSAEMKIFVEASCPQVFRFSVLTHESLGGIKLPPYIFCDISRTGRAMNFKLCVKLRMNTLVIFEQSLMVIAP